MDHFHDQMRFAERGAAWHGCADCGGDLWVEEIHIEAHMQQAIGLRHTAQKCLHRFDNAQFINAAHVIDINAQLSDEAMFCLIHRT